MSESANNIVWHQGHLSRSQRWNALGQRGATVWFTGLSGSGKSSVAIAVEKTLIESGRLTYVLDGDNIRHGLNRDLGFTAADRDENVRRVAEVGRLLADAGAVSLILWCRPTEQPALTLGHSMKQRRSHFSRCLWTRHWMSASSVM